MRCIKCHEDVEKYLLMRESPEAERYIRICVPCFKKQLKHIKSTNLSRKSGANLALTSN
jgi:hypothetical protein